jgi:hypothetical protein
MSTNRPQSTWENSPGMWFSILCNALAEHDFARAAEAQENLERLGVSVRFQGLSTIRNRINDQPAGKEVAVAR